MWSHDLTKVRTRTARTVEEAFRGPRYADPIERPEPQRRVIRTALWLLLVPIVVCAVLFALAFA